MEESLVKIQSKIEQALLIRLGYSLKMPEVVLYRTESFGGLGFYNLYTAQDITKINIVFRHIKTKKLLLKILMINLEWTQLVCSTENLILEYPNKE